MTNEAKREAAQVARDRILEQTALLVVRLAEKAKLANEPSARNLPDYVSDLRRFTDRER